MHARKGRHKYKSPYVFFSRTFLPFFRPREKYKTVVSKSACCIPKIKMYIIAMEPTKWNLQQRIAFAPNRKKTA